MIVYEATKQLFVEDVVQDRIEENIDRKFYEKMGYHTSKSERNAWNNSMQYMMKVLIDNNIPGNVGIAIEFKIPNTSKRVDFIITGKDGKLKNTAIIVELKQWTEADIVSGKDGIVKAVTGHALREVAHPSYQAWSYATTIEDYNETVQDRQIDLHPCAYLHNYLAVTPPTLLSDDYKTYLEKAPAFIKGDVEKLRDFINKYIKYGDDKETLYMIENGKIRPSKSLQDALSSMLKGNEEFVMIDDQKLVYETALDMARKSYRDGNKRVLIVKGGPGTGKSVLAINLLVKLTNPKYNFAMSWNLGNSQTWAIDPNSVNEVGCIHTCQGLEFDYVGVIIGNDLRYEDNKIVTDVTERAKTDQSIKGIYKMYKQDFDKAEKIADEIIKNTYRTLMTRGQKGCYIYCTDKKLSDYLKKRLNRNEGIVYPIDGDENYTDLMVAEDSEEYRYE